jgi:fatty acid desaturase
VCAGNSTKQICDFRLTTRSFYLRNPIVRCWYWNMNYHIEHHMYAAVPCYNLPTLHEAIKHDLPPTPDGIWETWKVIIPIMRRQTLDPAYVGPIELPAKKRE